jgi:phenylalanyl-tRNA synthetase alpha chain
MEQGGEEMNISETVEGLSRNERRLMLALHAAGGCSTPEELIAAKSFDLEVEIMGSASWLASKGLAEIKESTSRFYELADAGVVSAGLPERRAIRALDAAGGSMSLKDLSEALPGGDDKIAIGWLKRKGLADMVKEGDSRVLILTDKGRKALEERTPDEELLERMLSGPVPEEEADASAIKDLKGRQGMVQDRIVTDRRITLTPEGTQAVLSGMELKEEITDITDRIIQSGRWKDAEFRKYDVQTFAPAVSPAKKHPLTRLGAEVRRLFTDMGFTEFDGEYVQPAFWNLDVLFTPQDHPARDLQDTFYLESPSSIRIKDEGLVDAVRRIHEDGGDTGSTGWGGVWSRERAEAALLRPHTTVNSIRYVSEHPDPPVKMFSLSRIFRKESIDSTHLPEFTQIEGIIIDENGNFDMLVSVIREFYSRMGFDQIRIRPAYFPYTEPSLELEVFFNGKWMELGGAGIFRPEVVAPFGVKHPVLAWGFGFERLAMLKWNITDIRDLYISDLDDLKRIKVL